MKIKRFYTGYCKNFEKATLRTGKWKIINFPALAVYVEHPLHGKILFDTGYAEHLFIHCRQFPLNLYPLITPITFQPENSVANQLKADGIAPESINHVIISHFHADHISGLRDFPNAKFHYKEEAFLSVKNLSGFRALKAAFVPGLIPDDFHKRTSFVNLNTKVSLPWDYISEGYDLFGDRSMIAIDLPGHAKGQIGMLITNESNKYSLFVADASWSKQAIENNELPNWLGSLVLENKKEFQKTLEMLHQFSKKYPEIEIIPTHCLKSYEMWKKEEP